MAGERKVLNSANSIRLFRKGIEVDKAHPTVRREFAEKFPQVTPVGRNHVGKLEIIRRQETRNLLGLAHVNHPKAVRRILSDALHPPLSVSSRHLEVPVEDIRFEDGKHITDPASLVVVVGDPGEILEDERYTYASRLARAARQDEFRWPSDEPFKFILAQCDPAYAIPAVCTLAAEAIGDKVHLTQTFHSPPTQD